MRSLLKNLVKLARISLASKDDAKYAIQQVNYMGKTTPVLMIFPYGHHANVPVDVLVTLLSCNGDESNLHAIAHDSANRIKELKPGEVIIFHPGTKSYTHYKDSGDIEIKSANNVIAEGKQVNVTATTSMNFQAPQFNFNGNTAFTGNVTANGKDIGSTHRHSGSPTAPTGAISNTGLPI